MLVEIITLYSYLKNQSSQKTARKDMLSISWYWLFLSMLNGIYTENRKRANL
jgi:hypothetical protein